MKGALATRLAGSADLYHNHNRKPFHSINFITAHDGFSLYDLVSYNGKHNEANGEGNRDGTNDNFSWNCGAEGPTSDPGIIALRQRQQRNMLLALMVSQGTPMMVMVKLHGLTPVVVPDLVEASLPAPPPGRRWCRLVDTNLPPPRDFTPGGNNGVEPKYGVQAYSSILLIAKSN
ncbi:Aamy domain-containing protein [Haematococcus lacustris]|uniref:Aamy domain-containing protein n=1 Tax=Haematococcus lacustris TaxID=44745 RepID=A0A699ZMK3_HAELA|nr:Aamy domain-containing protein [Haematococcus lacustris]